MALPTLEALRRAGRALVEAGTILGAERATPDAPAAAMRCESDHAPSIGACAALF